MASVNKAIIVGNCGRDPEIRYLPSGMAVCDISIATSSKRKDKNTGESIEQTEWHRVKFFDKLAEIVGQYVTKGSSIYVEGRITYGKFTNKDGNEVNTCDVIADSMQMLGGKSQGSQEPREPRQAPTPSPRQQAPQKPQQPAPNYDSFDDDIGF